MAVSTTMNSTYISAADAKANSANSRATNSIGTTDRGTSIVESNTELGQNAFLNILVAELSNMDPTQDQDSTAYVTQMAEFASIEQLNNLNTTMKNFSYQQMVGQVAIINEKDSDGFNKFGLITQVYKSGTATYATIQDPTTGEYTNYNINKVIGTSDSGYTSANFETALNSNFLSASALASSNAKAIVVETSTETDSDGNIVTNTTAKKCVIKGAYLDKQNSSVKVTVAFLDSDGNESDETKTYNYNDIVIAGDLSDEVMDEKVKDLTTSTIKTEDNSTDTENGTDSSEAIGENEEETASIANINLAKNRYIASEEEILSRIAGI